MPEETLVPRIPPHSEEAEQSTIGSVLIDPEALETACEKLQAEDFYNPRHKEIFEAVLDLYTQKKPVDLVTVKAQLETRGTLEAAGGLKYLSQIAAAVPNSVYAGQYIKIIKDRSLYRRYIALGNKILTRSFSADMPIDALSEDVEQEVYRILQNQGSSDFRLIRDVLLESFGTIEETAKNGGQISGIPTGFTDLDAKLTGLHPSDLIIIGARPSMGMTAFGLNLVQNAAVKSGKTCAVFSLEMSAVQVVNRILSVESGVELNKFRTGELEDGDWEALIEALGPLSQAKIYIDDTGGITMSQVREKSRKLKIEQGLDLIMIDYLQLMSGSARGSENRQQEISEISRGLKMLARELDVPVIALSQLGRGLESRADHRPMMSDLRESGAIEQDADVVMFIYRDEYYHPDTEEKNVAEIIVAKQRNGPVGTEKLRYDGQFTRFSNLLHAQAPYGGGGYGS
ncbi:MAG: replicative DNA helicase [Firmicutes bacterium]|nr:replicative DNA helicase [Bacillota bacterium]